MAGIKTIQEAGYSPTSLGYDLKGSGPREVELEDPLLNPLDFVAGGLAGIGRAVAKKAAPVVERGVADYLAGLKVPAGSRGPVGKAEGMFDAISHPGAKKIGELTAGYAIAAPVAAGLVNTAADIDKQGKRWVEDQRKSRREFEANRKARKYVRNNPVASLDPNLTPDEISDQIAGRLGVPSDYLKTLTRKESGNNPNAKAPTSSAEGLTQFTDGTWDRTLEKSGEMLGYRPDEGHAKPMRRDPRWSVAAGAELAKANAEILKEKVGRKPTQGEVYMAHFMGASVAGEMIRAIDNGEGNKPAAALYPKEARANQNVFYTKSGKPRTVEEVVKLQTAGFSDQEF